MNVKQPASRHAAAGRRRHSRLRLHLPARLMTITSTFPVTLLDLSQTGARIKADTYQVAGDAVLTWDRFEVFCRIAWIGGEQCGLDFEEPIGQDILLVTRNLVRTDPDCIANRAAARRS